MNKTLNTLVYRATKQNVARLRYTPPCFVASVSMVCNLRCPTCLFTLNGKEGFDNGGFMKVDDFKAIVEKYAGTISAIGMSGGEVLLHPEIDQLLGIIKSHGFPAVIATNGTLIKKKIDIVKNFELVSISIDAYNPETYKQARGGTPNQFQDILDGIELLKRHSVRVDLSFMLTEQNIINIFSVIEFAKRVKPSSIGFHNINPHGSKEYTPLLSSSDRVFPVFECLTAQNDYPFDIALPVVFNVPSRHFITAKCPQPWYHSVFDDKGDMAPCCHLRHDPIYGNILTTGFNTGALIQFREYMMKWNYPKDDCLYCQRRFLGEEYGNFDSKTKTWALRKDKATALASILGVK